MLEDFQALDFHHLKESKHKQSVDSDSIRFQGAPCIDCKGRCSGFRRHRWRHGCLNCKCPLSQHGLTNQFSGHPFIRLGVDEVDPPLTSEYQTAVEEGFTWVPRGLRTSQIDIYMRKIPKTNIPRIGSDGEKQRIKQIICQIPLQDFIIGNAKFMPNDWRYILKSLRKRWLNEAIGIGAVRAAVSSSGYCIGCSKRVNVGNMVVFTERFGANVYWHPSCFKCTADGENLVDLIYFAEGKNIFCGRHWYEQKMSRCHGCDELILTGEYMKALDKSWHIEHFCCWHCDALLSRSKYIAFGDKPLCKQCYNKNFASVCSKCGLSIVAGAKDLQLHDNHYHEQCLVCSECSNTLKDRLLLCENEKMVCCQCHGINAEKCGACQLCKHKLSTNEIKVCVGSEYYHEACFLCLNCENPIGSGRFIRNNDNKFCSSCYGKSAKVCSKCSDVITGVSLNVEGNFFHAKCFCCVNCSKEIGGKKESSFVISPDSPRKDFSKKLKGSMDSMKINESKVKKALKGIHFYRINDEPYCGECYSMAHSKRCACCNEAIEANTKYVEYGEKYWHSKCFVCSKCRKRLAGEKFLRDDESFYCSICK